MHPVEVTLFVSSEFVGHVSTGAELPLPPHTPTQPPSPAEFKQKKEKEKIQLEAPFKGLLCSVKQTILSDLQMCARSHKCHVLLTSRGMLLVFYSSYNTSEKGYMSECVQSFVKNFNIYAFSFFFSSCSKLKQSKCLWPTTKLFFNLLQSLGLY